MARQNRAAWVANATGWVANATGWVANATGWGGGEWGCACSIPLLKEMNVRRSAFSSLAGACAAGARLSQAQTLHAAAAVGAAAVVVVVAAVAAVGAAAFAAAVHLLSGLAKLVSLLAQRGPQEAFRLGHLLLLASDVQLANIRRLRVAAGGWGRLRAVKVGRGGGGRGSATGTRAGRGPSHHHAVAASSAARGRHRRTTTAQRRSGLRGDGAATAPWRSPP